MIDTIAAAMQCGAAYIAGCSERELFHNGILKRGSAIPTMHCHSIIRFAALV
jgi:hypothetical protein